MINNYKPSYKRAALWKSSTLVSSVILVGVYSSPALTKEFSFGDDWKGSFDASVTYSTMFRVSDIDPDYLTIGKGGNEALGQDASNLNPNKDDGNRNFDKGDQVSNTLKLSYDFEIKRDIGNRTSIGFLIEA